MKIIIKPKYKVGIEGYFVTFFFDGKYHITKTKILSRRITITDQLDGQMIGILYDLKDLQFWTNESNLDLFFFETKKEAEDYVNNENRN